MARSQHSCIGFDWTFLVRVGVMGAVFMSFYQASNLLERSLVLVSIAAVVNELLRVVVNLTADRVS